MNRNPIEVLFGPEVLFMLRHKPGTIKTLAERIKPLLMAAVHPDKNRDVGPEAAAAFSEAFLELSKPGTNVEELILSFLRKERAEAVRVELRDARQVNSRLTGTIAARDKEIERLKNELLVSREGKSTLSDAAWRWLMSGVVLESGLLKTIPDQLIPEGAIPRGMLHHFRVITEYRKRKGNKPHLPIEEGYTAYEFDIAGRVRSVIVAESLEDARNVRLFRDNTISRRGLSINRSRGNRILIGSAPSIDRTIPPSYLVSKGLVEPYIMVGNEPMFVSISSYQSLSSLSQSKHSIDVVGMERIIEVIKLDEARKKAIVAGRPKPVSSVFAKKRKQKIEQNRIAKKNKK